MRSAEKRVLVWWLALAVTTAGGGMFFFRGETPDEAIAPQRTPLPPAAGVAAAPVITPVIRAAGNEDPASGQVSASVLTAMIEGDPAGATRWLESLPARAERDPDLVRALTQWSGFDPIAAGAWVSTMPANPVREQLIGAHVRVVKIEGPRLAAQWLSTLPEAEQPVGLIEEIAREWLVINRAEAESWLAQTRLPPEQRRRLLAEVERGAQSS